MREHTPTACGKQAADLMNEYTIMRESAYQDADHRRKVDAVHDAARAQLGELKKRAYPG